MQIQIEQTVKQSFVVSSVLINNINVIHQYIVINLQLLDDASHFRLRKTLYIFKQLLQAQMPKPTLYQPLVSTLISTCQRVPSLHVVLACAEMLEQMVSFGLQMPPQAVMLVAGRMIHQNMLKQAFDMMMLKIPQQFFLITDD
ncbi:MAG: hypothetical protein EOM46_30940 [Gammaproteobacteria bacterium]|nr:hypothetical protein [Gammaproteobacteria bacterium]